MEKLYNVGKDVMPDSEAVTEPELGQFRIKLRLWLQLGSGHWGGDHKVRHIKPNQTNIGQYKVVIINIEYQTTDGTFDCGLSWYVMHSILS